MTNPREKLIEILQAKYDHFCDQCGVNKDLHYIENLADYLIAHGVTVQEWISVKDRLPTQEDAEKYLLEYEEYNEYLVMIEGAIIPTVLMFDGENWFNDADDMYAVTHWMPLPQPPKGE